MITRFGLLLILLVALGSVDGLAQSAIDKTSFYSAMASKSIRQIDVQLAQLKNNSNSDREAFEGALLMRKSEIIAVPAKKLNLFKQGHKKLETAITKNPANAEYRFLRLMVQENAPRSLGYFKNIEQDSKFLKDNYKNLSETTQTNVVRYSKKSKALVDYF